MMGDDTNISICDPVTTNGIQYYPDTFTSLTIHRNAYQDRLPVSRINLKTGG